MPASTDDDDQDRAWLAQVAGRGAEVEKGARALFEKYYRRLVGDMMRTFGLDRAIAEEMVQEGFVRAFKAAAVFRREARVFTWLYSIVANRCRDHLRSPKREDTGDDAQWGVIEAERMLIVDDGPDVEAMQRCVERQFALFAQRYPRHAEALAQVHFNHWTTREAAAARGCSVEAMRQYFVDCRRKIREYLEQCRHFLEP